MTGEIAISVDKNPVSLENVTGPLNRMRKSNNLLLSNSQAP